MIHELVIKSLLCLNDIEEITPGVTDRVDQGWKMSRFRCEFGVRMERAEGCTFHWGEVELSERGGEIQMIDVMTAPEDEEVERGGTTSATHLSSRTSPAANEDQMAQSSDSSFFSQEELNKLKSNCEMDGWEAVMLLTQKKFNELDNTDVNTAVTAESGSGKSTFINAIRGLRNDDEGAAKIGNTLMTVEPIGYPLPNLPNICLWDLPGIGTKQVPANKYLSKTEFKQYDFFIIISQSRFTENDAKLAKEIKWLEKNFYFIRSKIDDDLNTFEMEGEKFNAAEELDKIKNYYVNSLKEEGIPSPTVFLISNIKVNEFDFPVLNRNLPDILNNLKDGYALLSLPNTTLEIVEKKQKLLKKRIWMMSALFGGMGAIHNVSPADVCIQLLLKEIKKFHKFLRLDDASLQRLAKMAGKSVEDLKTVVTAPRVNEINQQKAYAVYSTPSISVPIDPWQVPNCFLCADYLTHCIRKLCSKLLLLLLDFVSALNCEQCEERT
ncbi:interferon-inducible GTPase 1-like [Stegostoma tigrinum]|uniref:interferon-inducible GTPase 1-like n=1 Tax=Stegostoma tigrinum TaxID=3053191 RepID=UPI0028704ACD|nr:interferon-inducible GTPase 1-like [Stegostoma tigrinum]